MMRTHYAPQAELDRWNAYLDPTTFDPATHGPILANLVGATTWAELRVREDAFVAIRAITLHTRDIPGSYDLDGLRAIHHHLFQDVYEWAGELRTVTTGKSEPFAKPEEIAAIMGHVADRVEQTRQLRGLTEVAVSTELARVHHETNLAHPFRLGNGRTQREFVTALASVSGHTIDWSTITGEAEAAALRRARRGDLAPLTVLYAAALGQVTPDGGPSARHGFAAGRSAGVWR
ncbi:MAG: Fic/DOC family protein [Propionibacteriaceae bacterium]